MVDLSRTGFFMPIASGTVVFCCDTVGRIGFLLDHWYEDEAFWLARDSTRWRYFLDVFIRTEITLFLVSVYGLAIVAGIVGLFTTLPLSLAVTIAAFGKLCMVDSAVTLLSAVYFAAINFYEAYKNIEETTEEHEVLQGAAWFLIVMDWILSPLGLGNEGTNSDSSVQSRRDLLSGESFRSLVSPTNR